MAITKARKDEIVDQYRDWLSNSRAIILTEYSGITMKGLDELRHNLREVGGEFHIVKNTLVRLVLDEAGYPINEALFEGNTAIGVAFEDAPATAKTIADFAKTSTFVNIKGGYLSKGLIDAEGVTALADLPPLPIMRAMLLGTISAPASKLVRVLAEPGRQIAAVVKAYADQEPAAQAAS